MPGCPDHWPSADDVGLSDQVSKAVGWEGGSAPDRDRHLVFHFRALALAQANTSSTRCRAAGSAGSRRAGWSGHRSLSAGRRYLGGRGVAAIAPAPTSRRWPLRPWRFSMNTLPMMRRLGSLRPPRKSHARVGARGVAVVDPPLAMDVAGGIAPATRRFVWTVLWADRTLGASGPLPELGRMPTQPLELMGPRD